MKLQNAVIVAFLLLLLSFIILADEKINFSFDDIISDTEASYPAHTFVYCDNFYRKEKNYTLRYPKVLNLDILEPRPGELNRGTLTLLSKYNYIEKIEDGAFDNYTNLNTLEIFLNSLHHIDDKVLTKTVSTSLSSLNLKGNNLQNLPTTAFQYLKNLLALDLSYNSRINLWVTFNGVNVTVFHEALSNLVYLDISYCSIGHFDDNIFVNLKSLQKLHMSGNPLTSVPIAIKSLSTLEDLQIKDSKIVKIDECDFCNLTKLKLVDLSNTKTLSFIHENAFGAITNAAADIPQLKEFSIESCNIQTIPEKLLNWTNLSNFDIRFNPLKCDSSNAWLINDIIAGTPSLLTKKITKNWHWSYKNFLTCSPSTTSRWSLLHVLFGNMCYNGTMFYDKTENYDSRFYYVCKDTENEQLPCRKYDNQPFGCYSNYYHALESHVRVFFDYSFYNANIKLHQRYFKPHDDSLVLQKDKVLPGLESAIKFLSLKNNKIQTIESGTFDKFTSLKVLQLGYNEISNIDGFIFPPSLTALHLNANKLKLISSKPFENLVNLDTLSLSKNPNILPVNSTETVFPAALSNLKYLSLKQCNITGLNDNIFVNLVSLESLILGKNSLTSIPTAINVLQNLKTLNIASSLNMTVLNGIGLDTNPNLAEIIVTSSSIQRIEDCAFCKFPNLKYVDLSFNSELLYIHENAFGDVCNEKSCQMLLSLRGCNNLTIPELPINCDCENDNLWTLENYNTLICKSPFEFKRKSYDEFFDEICRSRPAGAAIESRKENQNVQDSKENDSKDVDEKELPKLSDGDHCSGYVYSPAGDEIELSPYDLLMVVFVLSIGLLVILW